MKIILLILGIAVAVTLWRNEPVKPIVLPIQQSDKILAFGDSLTYGYGATTQESYPAVLGAMTGLEIINAGINGETSSEGLRRLPALLGDTHITHMILCFGGNDILQKLSRTQLKQNLRQMIKIAKSRGVKVLLISVPDIGILGLSALDLYEEVADETDTPLLSGVLAEILSDPRLKGDQVHPNAEGYRVLAERIEEKCREMGWIGE